jgi:hypothetical protein
MPSADTDVLIHVLWINSGLSCDGDSVALTAATQLVVEDPIPDEKPHEDGYRCGFGSDPITTSE